MIDKKREIFIRIEKVNDIVDLLTDIKEIESVLHKLFYSYDKLNFEENKVFENWNNYFDEIVHELEHVTL